MKPFDSSASDTAVSELSAFEPLTPIAHEVPLMPGVGRFHGQTAVVTGGSRGMGKAIAGRLRREGAEVAILARGRTQLLHAARTIRAYPLCGDLLDPQTPARLIAHAQAAWGRLDILVINGAAMLFKRVDDCTEHDFDTVFGTNVKSAFLTVRAALPMLRRSRGQIVFINSTVVRASELSGRGLYAASKLALKGLADALRDEVNVDGVRVVSVLPGRTATEGGRASFGSEGAWHPDRLIQVDDVAALVAEAVALPRTAEITDLYVRPLQKYSGGV